MKNLGLVLFCFYATAFLGCSNGSSNKSDNKTETYQYEYTDNMCSSGTTGKHTFSTKDEYCKALPNEVLNQNCDRDLRKRAFVAQGCPGNFDSDVVVIQTKPESKPQTEPSTSGSGSGSNSDSSSGSGSTSGSNSGSASQPAKPAKPVDPTEGWKQKIVLKPKQFTSASDDQDFLSLVRSFDHNMNVYSVPENPQKRLQKFSWLLAAGVLLECTREYYIVVSNISDANCQLSVDPTQATSDVSISVSGEGPSRYVEVFITRKSLLFDLREGTRNLGVLIDDTEEVEFTDKAGKKQKAYRLGLSCLDEDNYQGFKSCTLYGVAEGVAQ